MQAGIINKFCQLIDPEGIKQELIHIKSLNIDGVVVDCWWGIVEGWSPHKYVWSGYRELFNIIREFKLNLQVYIVIVHIILYMHSCPSKKENLSKMIMILYIYYMMHLWGISNMTK